MTAELEAAFPTVDVQQLPEGKGIFDVKVDGQLVFSKYDVNRFPESGEVSGLIADLKG